MRSETGTDTDASDEMIVYLNSTLVERELGSGDGDSEDM
jgi:hypothetical protein